MAQADLRTNTSKHAPSRFVHTVTGAGADRIVRLSSALRAIAELCWDGDGVEADAAPSVTRGDLSALLWLVQGHVEAHVDEVMASIEEPN